VADSKVQTKRLPKPAAWKNSYFWFAGFLFVVVLYGLVRGPEAVRDPGQVEEPGLIWIYLGGAVVLLINGILSHRATVQHYEEEMAERGTGSGVLKVLEEEEKKEVNG